jgi:succinoglycan biosynthesis transport protein ExoP
VVELLQEEWGIKTHWDGYMTERETSIKNSEGYTLREYDATAPYEEQSTLVEPSQERRRSRSSQNDTSIYLGDILEILVRYVFFILIAAVLTSGFALGFSLVQEPKYEGSIKMLVGQRVGSEKPEYFLNVYDLQLVARTSVEMVETTPVAQATIQRLNLQTTSEAFLKNLSAEQISNTQVVEISYRHSSPERAAQIANTVGEVFAERIGEAGISINPLTAKVWERAPVPDDPASPKPLRNALAGLAAGLIFGVVMAFVLEALRRKRPAKFA